MERGRDLNTAKVNWQYIKMQKIYNTLLCKGIYSTPDPAIAEEYATTFMYDGQRYKVLLQNRVNMKDTDVVAVKHVTHIGDYFVTAEERNIRPYGLLFKKM